MIIGNGLLAKAFNEYSNNDDILIFASGVSNSSENNEKAFLREEKLLTDTIRKHPSKKFIYFSTCSIYDKAVNASDYVAHKLKMEKLLTENCPNYLVLRLTNVVGRGGNQNTIFNFLFEKVKNKETITVWENATRNILDVEHVVEIADSIISSEKNKQIINIGNIQSFEIFHIVSAIEQYLGIEAKTVLVEKGEPVRIDISEAEATIANVVEGKQENYIAYLLDKYYSIV